MLPGLGILHFHISQQQSALPQGTGPDMARLSKPTDDGDFGLRGSARIDYYFGELTISEGNLVLHRESSAYRTAPSSDRM